MKEEKKSGKRSCKNMFTHERKNFVFTANRERGKHICNRAHIPMDRKEEDGFPGDTNEAKLLSDLHLSRQN